MEHKLIFNSKYTIVDKTIIVESCMDSTVYENMKQQLIKTIIDTNDKLVREALIKLGWTPPEED